MHIAGNTAAADSSTRFVYMQPLRAFRSTVATVTREHLTFNVDNSNNEGRMQKLTGEYKIVDFI